MDDATNKRRRGILAALQPACDVAMARKPVRPWNEAPGLAVRNEGTTRELMIYGTIGGGSWFDDDGITASDVASALKVLGSGPVDVRINSGGGDVFQGVAIHTLLARHSGLISVDVDGLAASAASFIAMAGDRVRMARNGFMMIHDGMTSTYGNRNTHIRNADLLDKVSGSVADMYAERAGEDVEYWRELMLRNEEDGMWWTGQEALEAGLVDEITGGEEEKEARATALLLAGWSDRLPTDIRATLPLVEDPPEDTDPPDEDEVPPPPVNEIGREMAFAMLAGNLK